MQFHRFVMARPDMSGLSQETLAILGVGVALAALILTSIAGVRGEIHAVREELRVEIQAAPRRGARRDPGCTRDEARAENQASRYAPSRAASHAHRGACADREAFQSQILRLTEVFQGQILRLTEQQGVLSARIDGLRDPPAANP